MFEAGLVKLLTDNAPAIGGVFYPGELPQQAALPAGTYTVVAAPQEPTTETPGLQRHRYQFDCYGSTSLAAMTLRDGLRAFLNGYVGGLTDGTFLQNASLADMQGPRFDPDRKQFYCMVEFYLLFNFS